MITNMKTGVETRMDIYALFSVIPQLHLITFDTDWRMIRSNDNIGPLFSAFLSTEEYMEMIFSHGKTHDTPPCSGGLHRLCLGSCL